MAIFKVAPDVRKMRKNCDYLSQIEAVKIYRKKLLTKKELIVNTPNDTSYSLDGKVSLRMALSYVNDGLYKGIITFASSLNGLTIKLSKGPILIKRDVTVSGNVSADGKPCVTIDALGISTVFVIQDYDCFNKRNVTIQNMIISGGKARDLDYYGLGGAIANAENLTLKNSKVSGNISARTGGGIYSGSGNLIIYGCTICDNEARLGGAIGMMGGEFVHY